MEWMPPALPPAPLANPRERTVPSPSPAPGLLWNQSPPRVKALPAFRFLRVKRMSPDVHLPPAPRAELTLPAAPLPNRREWMPLALPVGVVLPAGPIPDRQERPVPRAHSLRTKRVPSPVRLQAAGMLPIPWRVFAPAHFRFSARAPQYSSAAPPIQSRSCRQDA